MFEAYSADAMVMALRRALATHGDAALWARVQRNGMARDFGWDASAMQYVRVYETALANARH